MCDHRPLCPDAQATDRLAARVVIGHPEQGWSRLCNGIVLFDDAGALLPDDLVIVPAARAVVPGALAWASPARASLTAPALAASC